MISKFMWSHERNVRILGKFTNFTISIPMYSLTGILTNIYIKDHCLKLDFSIGNNQKEDTVFIGIPVEPKIPHKYFDPPNFESKTKFQEFIENNKENELR